MILALAIFGVFIWLFVRRARHQSQQHLAFASSPHKPSSERLNQLHQLLPARKASSPAPETAGKEATETPIPEGHSSQPSLPPQNPPWPSSPQPPQWLIEAGFLKDNAHKHPPETPEKP